MKLTRRKFFTGLAAAPLVPVAVALADKLPVPDNGSTILARWSPTKYLGHTTIRRGIPAPDWRKLYEGVRPGRGRS